MSPANCFEVQPIIKRSFTPMERRRDDVVLCRARIGHAYFTNGYLLRGELRPMCCNTRLTVDMSFSVVRNMRTSEGSILHLIPCLSYSGTPLLVLLFSSFGNVTYITCFNY